MNPTLKSEMVSKNKSTEAKPQSADNGSVLLIKTTRTRDVIIYQAWKQWKTSKIAKINFDKFDEKSIITHQQHINLIYEIRIN